MRKWPAEVIPQINLTAWNIARLDAKAEAVIALAMTRQLTKNVGLLPILEHETFNIELSKIKAISFSGSWAYLSAIFPSDMAPKNIPIMYIVLARVCFHSSSQYKLNCIQI